jgi:imidazolonepropionase-like amidohydrolase
MLLIKNGYLKTMVGPDIPNGCVLIGDDGKIRAVGEEVTAFQDVTVIDAGGRLVTPGLVEAHCHTGLSMSSLRWEGAEYNEKGDPVTPQMRAIDGLNPIDEKLDEALEHGVTTMCTGPGSANVVGGTFVAVKLVGRSVDRMILKYPVAMKCAFGENPKSFYGQSGKTPVTRMGTASLLRDLLTKTKNYLAAKEAGKDPAYDTKLEAMIPVLRREIPLKAHAHRADDILTAIRIAKEFDVRLTLDHCTEGALIADILAEEGYPAFVGPFFGDKTKPELCNKSAATPGILHRAGVSVSIITDASVTPLKYLALCAGLAVAEGLDYEEGWRAITINPARGIEVADRVGSLEVGKDADLVIWTEDPLKTVGATAYMTVVDGKVVHSLA